MAATDVSNVASTVLKTLYSNDAIENLVYEKAPLLAMVKKDESFDGYNFRELLEYGDIKGVGNIFSTALANVAASNEAAFLLTRVKTYAIAQLTGEVIEASRNANKAAFVSMLKRSMDSAAHAIGQTLSHQIYRSKYGERGVISAITSATPSVITLTNVDDVVNFEVGMKLKAGTTTSGALHHATADTITAIDRDAGTITMTVNCVTGTTPSGWAANDYLFRDSDTDATAGAGSSGLCMSGLADWCPSTAPGATAFFGVDRSGDVTRLGGIRFDGSSYSINEALVKAMQRASRESVAPTHCFMNPSNFGDLINLLGSKVEYATEGAYKNPTISFEGIRIYGPNGPIKIFPDPFCPVNVAYLMELKVLTLRSLNKAPHILNLDSQDLLRTASADSYELRWGAYYQLGCSAPGKIVRVALA